MNIKKPIIINESGSYFLKNKQMSLSKNIPIVHIMESEQNIRIKDNKAVALHSTGLYSSGAIKITDLCIL
jgi:hypothetical protein